MDDIKGYLRDGTQPSDKAQARKLRLRSTRYMLMGEDLYRRSFTFPLLRCLTPRDAEYAMKEVHEGICGNHPGGRTLAYKLMRQGYYWPTMKKDCLDFVKKCGKCQKHANIHHLPAAELTSLTSPCPFAQWGLDILGPFPIASGQRKFIFVAIDYFTKWVEAEATASITDRKAKDFVWRSVVCRFGLPLVIITDNGTQFDSARFKDFCSGLGIQLRFTSVSHPQTNGQAEATNKAILHGLRTKLEAKANWADELPEILWGYRTTEKAATGETPFALAFGTEAIAPVEVGIPSLRRQVYEEEANSQALRHNLDLIEEVRIDAQIRMELQKRAAARFYNRRVKHSQFNSGDLVLKKVTASGRHPGKLGANWEGPFRVTEVIKPGTYRLAHLNGKPLPHPWNAQNLRAYYQ